MTNEQRQVLGECNDLEPEFFECGCCKEIKAYEGDPFCRDCVKNKTDIMDSVLFCVYVWSEWTVCVESKKTTNKSIVGEDDLNYIFLIEHEYSDKKILELNRIHKHLKKIIF
jgi:hypothetical protein